MKLLAIISGGLLACQVAYSAPAEILINAEPYNTTLYKIDKAAKTFTLVNECRVSKFNSKKSDTRIEITGSFVKVQTEKEQTLKIVSPKVVIKGIPEKYDRQKFFDATKGKCYTAAQIMRYLEHYADLNLEPTFEIIDSKRFADGFENHLFYFRLDNPGGNDGLLDISYAFYSTKDQSLLKNLAPLAELDNALILINEINLDFHRGAIGGGGSGAAGYNQFTTLTGTVRRSLVTDLKKSPFNACLKTIGTDFSSRAPGFSNIAATAADFLNCVNQADPTASIPNDNLSKYPCADKSNKCH